MEVGYMSVGFVEAMYPYEYVSGNGHRTTMDPGDRFTLIKKSNSDWWYVHRQGELKPVYLPATYLKEVQDQDKLNSALGGSQPVQEIRHDNGDASLDSPLRKNSGSSFGGNNSRSRQGSLDQGVTNIGGVTNRIQNELTIPEADYAKQETRTKSVKRQAPQRPNQLSVNSDGGRLHGPRFGEVSPGWRQSPTEQEQSHRRLDHDLYAGWETLKDEHGRQYYYNRQTQQTQWNPPKSADTVKSDNLPLGWREEVGSNGEVHSYVHEKDASCRWFSSTDDNGKTYYYNEAGETCWELPEDPRVVRRKDRYDNHGVERRVKVDMRPHSMFVERPGQRGLAGGFTPNIAVDSRLVMEKDCSARSPNFDIPAVISSPILPSPVVCSPSDHMMIINHSPSSPHPFSPPPSSMNVQRRYSDSHALEDISPETIPMEKEGILSRMKLVEGGKKAKLKWCPYYTVLTGSSLRFYKDTKLKEKTVSTPSTPESHFDMYGAELKWPKGDRAKLGRKFAFELHSNDGSSEFLLQGETEQDCLDWFEALNHNVRALGPYPKWKPGATEDIPEQNEVGPPTSPLKSPSVPFESVGFRDERKKNIREKLKSFINKRPNQEVLKKKGILKEENVFGKRLDHLCEKEKSSVPKFVKDCINAIDDRGLDIDGIYRVSGNLSMIQKLRFQVDQEKPVDLNSPPWKNDIHVIAGSLKLFFRELPEPLFTFKAYDNFIATVAIQDTKPRNKKIREALKSLPHVNQETIKFLFGHLNRVISHGEQNRMRAQNIAIVFGPTLMWAKDESFNMATNLAFQNRLMEIILSDYEQIFHSK